MAAALQSGDHMAHGYKSRSDMIQGLALAFVNAEATEDEFVAALLDPRNGAGNKLLPRRKEGARRYLNACWQSAQERAAAQPAISGRRDALEEIARIRAAAAAYPWPARSGAYDWALMEAHFTVATHAGKLVYHADVRTLAELSGMSIGTVSKAHRRLRDAGWLRLVKRARWSVDKATEWRLQVPSRAVTSGNTPTMPAEAAEASSSAQRVTCANTPTQKAGGDAGECFREERRTAAEATGHAESPGADVWRHAALGKACFRVWQHLHPQIPQTVKDLGEVLRRKPASIRRQLRRLALWKFAIRDEARAWLRGDGDTDYAAWNLGTFGEDERQRRRHEGDRETFRLGWRAEQLRR
ncbi:MAG TPA: hypothetical protein VE258_03530, partial [Ktedonobacterales bacterium]|nr:hypothetical protein [Ktedonobacterales bacterium]